MFLMMAQAGKKLSDLKLWIIRPGLQVLVALDTLFERGKRELDEKQRRKKRTEKYFQLDFRHNDLGGEFVGMNLDNRLWEYVKVRGQENPFQEKIPAHALE